MKLLYTSVRNTSKPKNKLYFNNVYFNKTNKNIIRRRGFIHKSSKVTTKSLANKSFVLNYNNRSNTRRSMKMFVPFSKTRKCGGCFRH